MDPNRRRLAGLGLGLLLAAIAAPVMLLLPGDAQARVSFVSQYTKEQTYNAALRLVRVDLGHKVTERDPDAGYILFEYTHPESGKRVTPGSIELAPRSDGVTVVVQLPQMPQYHEESIAEQLRRKMLAEYGEPPKREPPKRDGGADSGKEAGSDNEEWAAPEL